MPRYVGGTTRIRELLDLEPRYSDVVLSEVRPDGRNFIVCSSVRDDLRSMVRVPADAAYEFFHRRHVYPTVQELKNYVNGRKKDGEA